MHLRDIKDLDREGISELIWKWRCKIFPKKNGPSEKEIDLEIGDEDISKADGKTTINGKDPTFGSEAVIKTMYEGKNSRATNSTSPDFDWVDYPPKQLSKSAAKVQDRVAIKVYKIKDRDKPSLAGRFPLMYHRIDIQNPLLVAALAPIVKKENLLLDVHETAEFHHPFRPLWFCQEDIAALHKQTEPDDPLKTYLHLLLRILDEMFAEMRLKRRHLLTSNLVDFMSAWTLFARGSTIYSYEMNSEILCKTEGTSYGARGGRGCLFIEAKVLKFDGVRFVWAKKILAIPEFEANRAIRELHHYPLVFHPNSEELKRRLVSRGKKALDLQGLKYCCYTGIALRDSEENGLEKHNVEGRILIDATGYNKYHLAIGKREHKSPDARKNELSEADQWGDGSDSTNPSGDAIADAKTKRVGRGKRLSDEEQLKNKELMLSRESDLGYISGMVNGFALKNKLWVQFYIEDIEPIIWNDSAYSHLVYDEQQKDLVLSFVENHDPLRLQSATGAISKPVGANEMNTVAAPLQDVILGKGQGLIILLSGPPGTGKTLTAEAVADRTHKPLFYLQAEDLGINAASLGANIKRVFEMATEWDAVILLDEADVFMAERNPNDIHRNELVSIFLRELEYFRGVIFLTTNLYHTIDSAFRSRVSLHLLFQALSRDARETVWCKFMQRLPKQIELVQEVDDKDKAVEETPSPEVERPLNDEDIRELSLWQLNGREIKNAVRMVRSWCDHKGYMMTLKRLESGIRVTSPHASKDADVDGDLYE